MLAHASFRYLCVTVLAAHISSLSLVSRRNMLASSSILFIPSLSRSETVGKDESCNDSTCLGVWDGILANCGANNKGAGCVSSQDDETPGVFSEPWDYSEVVGDWDRQQQRLLPAVQRVCVKRDDIMQVVLCQGRYTRIKFIDRRTLEESIGEFYFTVNDSTVQYRIASVSPNTSLISIKNKERAELIRKELGYLRLPVVRTGPPELSPGEWALAKTMGLI
jgi:uncharacterized protein (DUF1499 family)